jgi:hypothetical protein
VSPLTARKTLRRNSYLLPELRRQSALGLATKGPLRAFLSTPKSIDSLSDNGRIGVVYHVTRILDEMQY